MLFEVYLDVLMQSTNEPADKQAHLCMKRVRIGSLSTFHLTWVRIYSSSNSAHVSLLVQLPSMRNLFASLFPLLRERDHARADMFFLQNLRLPSWRRLHLPQLGNLCCWWSCVAKSMWREVNVSACSGEFCRVSWQRCAVTESECACAPSV